MKDGSYHYALEMLVPLGRRLGGLELRIDQQRVGGSLTLFTNTTPITEGTCIGNVLRFTGTMKTLMKSIAYTASGTVRRRDIVLDFETAVGTFHATGKASDLRRRAESQYEREVR